jgi:hypothetical protein
MMMMTRMTTVMMLVLFHNDAATAAYSFHFSQVLDAFTLFLARLTLI